MNILIPLGKATKKIKSANHHSLVKIKKNKNLIQFQMDILSKVFEFASIYFVVDDEKDLIIEALAECQYSNLDFYIIDTKYDSLSSCLSDILDSENTDWLVIMGDVVFNKSSIKAVCKKQRTSFLADTHNFFLKSKVGLWHNNGVIQHFSYTLPLKWAKICYLEKGFISQFVTHCKTNFAIHEIFNSILNIEPANVVQHHHAKALEIVNPKDVKLARQVFGDI